MRLRPDLFEAVPDAMVIVDRRGRIVYANALAAALFDYAATELVGELVEVLVPDRLRGGHGGHRDGFFGSPKRRPMGVGLALRARRRDGSEFPAEISLAPLTTEEGEFVTAAIRDVSGRRKVEERFRALLEATPDAMVIVDGQGTIVLVNSQTERVFGYPRAELIGSPVERLVPARHRVEHVAHRTSFAARPRVRAMGSGLDLRGVRKDGTEFPIEISLGPLEVDGETLVLSAIRDVTERVRAEAARSHLAAIVTSSDDAICGRTLDGLVSSWNRGAERLFGYTADEAIGQPFGILVPEGHAAEVAEMGDHWARDNIVRRDTVRLRKDGTRVVVSLTVSPVRDPRGAVVGVAMVARDISERLRTEAALTEAKDRAESSSAELEAFSYSVAHDLRAPLRAMSGFAQVLREDHQGALDADGIDCLDEIQSNARRMGDLIDGLLALSRVTRSELRRERVDLSALTRDVVNELARAPDGRAVEMVIEDGLEAEADPRLARTLLVNLLANAWKFTSGCAAPRVEVGRHRGEGATSGPGQGPGLTSFFVRDNGAGFDMAHASKLFAPFQRLHTQREFPGTGIGLATVQRIVRRHGGTIWAEGALGRGAVFYFTFDTAGASPAPGTNRPPRFQR